MDLELKTEIFFLDLIDNLWLTLAFCPSSFIAVSIHSPAL